MVKWGRKYRETDEDALNWSFSWPWGNLREIVKEVGKLQGWGIAVSIFEMDQN